MEIEVLCQNFAKKDPKLLVDYVQSAGSGEVPFFPVTLSLVYDKLVGTAFPKGSSSDSNPEKTPGDLAVTTPNTSQASGTASVTALPPASDASPSTAPRCVRCRRYTQLEDLYDGLHCPWCPETGKNGLGIRGRPFMACSECNFLRTTRVDECLRCGATFFTW